MRGTIISNITDEQKERIISDFLIKLGSKLKAKRRRMNLSQSELSAHLDIDQTTLSKYENGDRDMSVSLLPLFSIYCNFPLHELFPKTESELLLEIFDNAVQVVVDRKKRQQIVQEQKELEHERNGVVFANMYSGKDFFRDASPCGKSVRSRYKDAEIQISQAAFDKHEFCEYILNNNDEFVSSIIDAGQLLLKLAHMPNKNTLKGLLADYIIDGLVINEVSHKESPNEAHRAYAYYKALFDEYMRES